VSESYHDARALPRDGGSVTRTAARCDTLLRELPGFSRQREWLFGSLLPLFGTFFLAALRNPSPLKPGIVAGWCAIVLFATACGYMLNNLADLEVDRQAGKPSPLGHWTYGARLLVAILFESASLLLTALLADVWTLAAVAFFHLVAWLYSFPPRFKEHRLLGPAAAATQFWAPSAVILIAWRTAFPAAICWIALLCVYGLRITIIHQVLDRENDMATGVTTTVATTSTSTVRSLLRMFCSAEIFLCFALVWLLLSEPLIKFTLPLLALPVANILWRRLHGEQVRLDTYKYVPLSELYETVFPLMFGITLFAQNRIKVIWALASLVMLLLMRHSARFGFRMPVPTS
jgi:4-hydroxybenzoate polyprenyltransferase